MLSMNKYTRDYVDGCRTRVESQLSAYKALVSAANAQSGSRKPKLESALEAFEPQFFNNLVLVLDNLFVHRTRALEKKDGNPLNEVRVLCASLLQNNGVLLADKTIRRSFLTTRAGGLSPTRRAELCRALRSLADC